MTYKERKALEEKSKKCFGRSSRWKTIMKRGRRDGDTRLPISVKEIDDTMDYILEERERILDAKNNTTGVSTTDSDTSNEA